MPLSFRAEKLAIARSRAGRTSQPFLTVALTALIRTGAGGPIGRGWAVRADW